MAPRLLSLVVCAVVLLATAGVARAQVSQQSELEKARNAYLAHQYDEADARFQQMLDPRNPTLRDRILINQARMYWGAVKIAQKQPEKASELFEELLMSDTNFEPDPLAFPTDVMNAFIDTRARLLEKLKAIERDKARREAERKARDEQERAMQVLRLKSLERLAGEEKTVDTHSRWVAMLPFGAGQFQNGQKTAGWVFLGLEAALFVGAAVCLPIYLVDLSYRSEAFAASDRFRAQEYLDRANVIRTANLVLDGAFAGVAAIGILQAQIAFIPEEVRINTRPLPPLTPPPQAGPSMSFHVAPVLSPQGGAGATFGLTGRF